MKGGARLRQRFYNVWKSGDSPRKRNRAYLYTGAATLLMLSILFLGLRIYPFGDNTLVYSDGDQYLSFVGYLQNCFFTNDNLLYSWSNVLGGSMLGTFAYYCASPFNLLLILFPTNLLLGYHVIFCVKVILAALFFAAMLNSVWEGTDEKAVMLFSAAYPFMGYMATYAWNQSWMDGVLCLPVLLTGIVGIVRRQKAALYVVALSLMLLSNYYTMWGTWSVSPR